MTSATPDLRSWFRLVAPQVQPTLFADCPRKGGQMAGENGLPWACEGVI